METNDRMDWGRFHGACCETNILFDNDQTTSSFGIQLEVAEKFGLSMRPKHPRGPNVKADYPTQKKTARLLNPVCYRPMI